MHVALIADTDLSNLKMLPRPHWQNHLGQNPRSQTTIGPHSPMYHPVSSKWRTTTTTATTKSTSTIHLGASTCMTTMTTTTTSITTTATDSMEKETTKTTNHFQTMKWMTVTSINPGMTQATTVCLDDVPKSPSEPPPPSISTSRTTRTHTYATMPKVSSPSLLGNLARLQLARKRATAFVTRWGTLPNFQRTILGGRTFDGSRRTEHTITFT